jgi:hypothetical protein
LHSSVGGPACPRCRASLAPASEGGIELNSFDPKPAKHLAPIAPWVLETDAFELRRLGRKLRPCLRPPAACAAPPAFEAAHDMNPPTEAAGRNTPPTKAAAIRPSNERALRGGAASVAADSGFLAMILGAATLAAQHEGMIAAEFWRWGAIGAGIGAAVFAFGVLRLATRAWRQGRDLEAEIDALRAEVAGLRSSDATSEQSAVCHWRPASVSRRTSTHFSTGGTPVAHTTVSSRVA